MTFRDGFLRARGQIVFVLALGLSTGVIVWLERLDTRRQDEVRQQATSGVVAPGVYASREILLAVRRAELAVQDAPDSLEATAALVTALSAASFASALDQSVVRQQVMPLLPLLEAADTPLATSALSLASVAFPEIATIKMRPDG
ncbi:hypothetical protein [Aurantimonas sp. HBX-1]|uniref:hypothetical protein n=1 Tax=Aurantimonas sp. HBX-1 TaxID=2906072 RepID=UPI001F2243CF|nr:hypothetical protein [Aurantimonas sp. HBX-1]UIJ70432.1 hypothetical protein LXB15_11690 [Aurantimonas sp. HBX-1]